MLCGKYSTYSTTFMSTQHSHNQLYRMGFEPHNWVITPIMVGSTVQNILTVYSDPFSFWTLVLLKRLVLGVLWPKFDPWPHHELSLFPDGDLLSCPFMTRIVLRSSKNRFLPTLIAARCYRFKCFQYWFVGITDRWTEIDRSSWGFLKIGDLKVTTG